MRSGSSVRPRSRVLRVILVAAVLLSAGGTVSLMLLPNAVAGVSVALDLPAPGATLMARPFVVVLRSDAAARGSKAHELRARTWMDVLERANLAGRSVSEAQLPASLADAAVLVLPGASCLAETTRRVVQDFLESGHGLVASGPVGTRDQDCRWRGFGYLERLTGAARGELRLPTGPVFAAFRGGQFYEGTLPAGFRLELPYQELATVQVAHPDAYASDWRLRPVRPARLASSAIATHASVGRGRVAWIGFDESPSGRRRAAQEALEGYLTETVRWAAGQLLSTVAAWPDGRPAAVVTMVVAGNDDARLDGVARALRAAGVPATFVLGRGRLPRVDLGRGAEIAASVGGEAPAAAGRVERAASLRRARRDLEASTGRRVAGFVPAAGLTDPTTIEALADAGLAYTLDELGAVKATPEVVDAPSRLGAGTRRAVVRLFRPAGDPETPAEEDADSEDLGLGFLSEFERLLHLGGVYPLVVHSDLVAARDASRVIGPVLQRIGASRAWVTSGSELARWWASRQHLRVAASLLAPSAIQVEVSNHGEENVSRVSVSVYLPSRPSRVVLRSSLPRSGPPLVALDADEPVLRLGIPELRGQSSARYVLALED